VEFTKQELLEVSAVAVPANPQALAKALSAGLLLPRLRSVLLLDPLQRESPGGGDEEQEGTALTPEQVGEVTRALRRLRESVRRGR